MKTKLFPGALAIAALITPFHVSKAAAFYSHVERSAPSGIPTHIWTFYNCVGRIRYPFTGTAFVEHGAVTFKEGVKNRCGLRDVITREVWYTSNPGFTGIDRVTFPRGHWRAEIFAITVR